MGGRRIELRRSVGRYPTAKRISKYSSPCRSRIATIGEKSIPPRLGNKDRTGPRIGSVRFQISRIAGLVGYGLIHDHSVRTTISTVSTVTNPCISSTSKPISALGSEEVTGIRGSGAGRKWLSRHAPKLHLLQWPIRNRG